MFPAIIAVFLGAMHFSSNIYFLLGYLELEDKSKVSGIKWISGFPTNIPKKLPTIVGVLILNDCETGMLKIFICSRTQYNDDFWDQRMFGILTY